MVIAYDRINGIPTTSDSETIDTGQHAWIEQRQEYRPLDWVSGQGRFIEQDV